MKAPSPQSRAFSLIELLVVMSLAAVFMALSIPVFAKIVLGSELTRAGQKLEGLLAQARQHAVSTNQEVRVLFYELPTNGGLQWRAIQIMAVRETSEGPQLVPVGSLVTLPTAIAIAPQLSFSPLLTADGAMEETVSFREYGQVRRGGFRFRPSGTPGSAVTAENNFLTLVRQEHLGDPGLPANYYTVQVESLTGKIAVFRP